MTISPWSFCIKSSTFSSFLPIHSPHAANFIFLKYSPDSASSINKNLCSFLLSFPEFQFQILSPSLHLPTLEHPTDPSAVSASGKSCEWGGLQWEQAAFVSSGRVEVYQAEKWLNSFVCVFYNWVKSPPNYDGFWELEGRVNWICVFLSSEILTEN